MACHYFTYDPLRRECQNDLACMDPLIVACYMGMPESIRTAGLVGIGYSQGATISDQGIVSDIRAYSYRTRFTCWPSVACCTKRVKRCVPLHCGMPLYPVNGLERQWHFK